MLDRIQELEINEKSIHAGQQVFKSDGHREMVLSKLTKRLARERKSVPDRLGRLKGRLGEQVNTLERCIAGLQRHISEMQSKKQRLTQELQSAKKDLAENSAGDLQTLAMDVSDREQQLRERGYGDAVLSTTHPSAFSAIQAMAQQRLLGHESRSNVVKGNKPMRILFMAANPVTTSPLDLEEELRSLEMELRGAKYRDKITFIDQGGVSRSRRRCSSSRFGRCLLELWQNRPCSARVYAILIRVSPLTIWKEEWPRVS